MEDIKTNDIIPVDAVEELTDSVSSNSGKALKTAGLVGLISLGSVVLWEKVVKPGTRWVKAKAANRKAKKSKTKTPAENEEACDEDDELSDLPDVD